METNASHIFPAAHPDLLALAVARSSPTRLQLTARGGRRGFRGDIYGRRRYGGRRCAVCSGLPDGWMPT